jgi:hypothetical protein
VTNRPSIFQVGRVDHDTFGQVRIHGWGVGMCITRCGCHYHPANGHLYVLEHPDGLLGLKCFLLRGCDCCQPWTCDELIQILRDLRRIDEMETTS